MSKPELLFLSTSFFSTPRHLKKWERYTLSCSCQKTGVTLIVLSPYALYLTHQQVLSILFPKYLLEASTSFHLHVTIAACQDYCNMLPTLLPTFSMDITKSIPYVRRILPCCTSDKIQLQEPIFFYLILSPMLIYAKCLSDGRPLCLPFIFSFYQIPGIFLLIETVLFLCSTTSHPTEKPVWWSEFVHLVSERGPSMSSSYSSQHTFGFQFLLDVNPISFISSLWRINSLQKS